jgi:hypothetical protein
MAAPQYGADHRRRRDELLADAYGTLCPLCNLPMLRGQELDLDHSSPHALDPGSVGDRIVHEVCPDGIHGNAVAGGELRQTISRYAPSRKWLPDAD